MRIAMSRETPEQMLQDIEESQTAANGIRLTEWEVGFVDSVEHQLGDGRRLTDKQRDCLARIWERA